MIIAIVLVNGHESRWLKLLPASLYGVVITTLSLHGDGILLRAPYFVLLVCGVPNALILGGISACVCALLFFSGKQGTAVGGGWLCGAAAAMLVHW